MAAAVPFYGPFPEGGNLSGAKAAVLGIYAGLDSQGQRDSRSRPAQLYSRPGFATRSSPTPASITPSSTRPGRVTTLRPRQPLATACSPGLANTSRQRDRRTGFLSGIVRRAA